MIATVTLVPWGQSPPERLPVSGSVSSEHRDMTAYLRRSSRIIDALEIVGLRTVMVPSPSGIRVARLFGLVG